MRPIRLALWGLVIVALGFASTPAAIVVAALLLGASMATSGIYTPAMALVSDRAEANGVPQTLGFGVMNSAWALGAMIGPAGGGALADGLGAPAPYLVAAALAVMTTTLLVRPALVGEAA